MTLTRYELTYPLFEVLPPLWSVRNPVKLQYPLVLSMSVLFGAGVVAILRGSMRPPGAGGFATQLSGRRATGGGDRSPNTFLLAVVIGLLVFSLFIYAMPAVGAFGHEEVRGEDYYVPEHYEVAAEHLDGRTLWLPYGYQTQLYLRHTHPDHVGIRSGGVLHGIPNADYVEELFADVAQGDDPYDRLADLGVEYIVVESDPPDGYDEGPPRQLTRWGAPWIWGNPDVFAERFDASDRYTQVATVEDLTIYRVEGVTEPERLQQRSGVHVLVTPETPSVERLNDDNLVSNPQFEDDFVDWWVPQDAPGRQTEIVELDDGSKAVSLSVNATAERRPIAQAMDVREAHPYELSIDATGDGEVFLFWFDGQPDPDNLVKNERRAVSELPDTIVAHGDTLSIRIRPNASSTLVVDEIGLYRTTYPSAIGLDADGEIPGIVTEGHEDVPRDATVVGVNLDEDEMESVDPDVVIIDAETVAGGELVFDEAFRHGVGVIPDADEWPDAVPDEATKVTKETEAGEAVDYWIAGEFDDRPLTVLHASYHENWAGSDDGEQFRADGWANGFTDTTPDEVHWTGGEYRSTVVAIWGGGWIITLGLLVGTTAHRRRQHRRL